MCCGTIRLTGDPLEWVFATPGLLGGHGGVGFSVTIGRCSGENLARCSGEAGALGSVPWGRAFLDSRPPALYFFDTAPAGLSAESCLSTVQSRL